MDKLLSDGRFHFYSADYFKKSLSRIQKADPDGARRIVAVMERLLENPAETDGMLTGPRRGLMKKYVGKSGYRLIYKWCQSCKKLAGEIRRDCPDCGQLGNESVVFFDVFHKADAARLGY